MEPLDTVADTEDWLDEDPGVEDAEALLEAEQDGPDRKTAIEAIEDYLEGSEESADTVPFRVNRSFGGHEVGDVIERDPDDPRTEAFRRDGRLTLWR